MMADLPAGAPGAGSSDTKDSEDAVEHADDICALPLARRLAAMLDRDPADLKSGVALPRGWHVMLFNVPTRQSRLRPDGAAHLGVTLPDLGLPRLMLGGRRIVFDGDIPIGASVRRETRRGSVELKQGRSGRFALVNIEHRVTVVGSDRPAVVETNSYLLREAGEEGVAAAASASSEATEEMSAALISRTIVPDEALLFRYSAITDNPHRIHYDLPYASGVEGYRALLVNGSIPAMFLLEMFRDLVGREPEQFESRNLAPMFCGVPLTLSITAADNGWRLSAADPGGGIAFDAWAR